MELTMKNKAIIFFLYFYLSFGWFIGLSYGANKGIGGLFSFQKTGKKLNDTQLSKIWESQGIDVPSLKNAPRLWILSIGVSKYKYGYDPEYDAYSENDLKLISNLKSADHDAQAIANALEKKGQLFARVEKKVLLNGQATKANILKGFKFLKRAGRDDVIVIFLSGHAKIERGEYFYITYDTDPRELDALGLSKYLLEKKINQLKSDNYGKRIVMILDNGWAQIKEIKGVSLFASSSSEALSSEKSEGKHSVFTYSLLKGLVEGDTNNDGLLTLKEWFGYSAQELPNLAPGLHRSIQNLQNLKELPIAVVGKVSYEVDTGWLTINTIPWGRVIIDGIEVGVTPIIKKELITGKYKVTIKRDNKEISKIILIEKNKLQKITGNIFGSFHSEKKYDSQTSGEIYLEEGTGQEEDKLIITSGKVEFSQNSLDESVRESLLKRQPEKEESLFYHEEVPFYKKWWFWITNETKKEQEGNKAKRHAEEVARQEKRKQDKEKSQPFTQPGGKPKFPWPPPYASAFKIVPRFLFIPSNTNLKLQDIANQLEEALGQAGYDEKSYFSVPGGFAMATRLEQINPDGTSKESPARWNIGYIPLQEFSLKKYIKALFAANSGYYRIIVFVVTSEPFNQSNIEITSDTASMWVNEGFNPHYS